MGVLKDVNQLYAYVRLSSAACTRRMGSCLRISCGDNLIASLMLNERCRFAIAHAWTMPAAMSSMICAEDAVCELYAEWYGHGMKVEGEGGRLASISRSVGGLMWK